MAETTQETSAATMQGSEIEKSFATQSQIQAPGGVGEGQEEPDAWDKLLSGQSKSAPGGASDEKEPAPPREASSGLHKANAKMWVATLNMLLRKLCRMFAGMDGNYGMTEAEKADYEVVCANYFEATGQDIPPGILFAVSTITIIATSVFQAFQDRKRNNATPKAIKPSAAQAQPTENTEIKVSGGVDINRRRFLIDSNGFFVRTAIGGRYLKENERDDKGQLCPAELRKKIEGWQDEKQTEAYINAECLKYLGWTQ